MLRLARDLLSASADIDIVGSGGSGRTSVLDALALTVADSQATVVRINGVRALRCNPLAAVHAAGIGSQLTGDRRPASPLQNAIDALSASVGDGRGVILIDDTDLLDEASLGAIEAVQRSMRVPTARTRSRLSANSAHTAGYVIDLPSLRYDDLEIVLSERLGGMIDAGTMSRVYAKSGGNVGLALTMIDLAAREGRLLLTNEVWMARRSLWSPSLRGAVETYLSWLGDEHREALEMIAMVGVSDLETALKLSDNSVLEQLEDAGVLRIVPSGSHQLVTVDPPLLSEFYRHKSSAVRRQRLASRIRVVRGSLDSLEAILADTPVVPHGLGDGDALFVRLVHERARTRRVVTEAEWHNAPEAGSAHRYLQALLADADSDGLVARTFAQTENSAGEPVDLARLAVLRAQWQLASGSDLEKTLRELRERVAGLGPAARLADAEAVLLEAAARGIPDDADDRLEAGGDLPHPIRTRLLEVTLTIATLRGRFAEAHALFDQLSALGTADISTDIVATHGYTLLGEGRHAEALAWAERGVDEAHANLDVSGLRAHSFIAALCLTVSGQYSKAENVISVALALGEPPLTDLSDHIGIQALASVVAVRRDNAALGERLRADIAATPAAGTLIGRSGLTWSTAQLVAYRGQPNEAAQLLHGHSDHLRGIGVHSGSVFALLSALELNPDPAGLEQASDVLRGMQSEFFDAHLAFLIALQDRDADAITALVPRLTASGRPGLAVVAFRLASEWLNEDGEHERARESDRAREEFIAALPSRSYDATRMFATAINLTEREISRPVASGLSNPQIAARLVLSVRTVESHLHRIMRKTSVSNRAELASLIKSIAV